MQSEFQEQQSQHNGMRVQQLEIRFTQFRIHVSGNVYLFPVRM